MSRAGYNLKQAFSQMGRNKGMYFTAILAITAMMLILGLFFVSFVNVNMFAKSIGKDYNVIQIYMKDGNTQEVTDAVGTSLEKITGVEKVEYVTKDQALEALKENWGDNGYLLDNLPENPLPDSYTVNVSDKDAANSVAETAPGIEGVDDVVYYRDTIEKLAQISHFIEVGSIAAMIFLVIVSIIIVANTIKLTVFNREKEIGIMKYLGATNWFVKAPFIWGGIIIGVLSSVIATGLTYLIYSKLTGIIGSDILRILSVSVVPAEQLTNILLIMFLCLGIGIGVIGSAISIRRFLNV
ncbi:MAG: permease-like cell division protein FtsX [Mogibacterium sp.]|nr:permease-like cell division protein FtsX [Mogibacterium sp.]MBQ6502229.1 permease-like cell division protein FtsX [Mogibacterium sp.]